MRSKRIPSTHNTHSAYILLDLVHRGDFLQPHTPRTAPHACPGWDKGLWRSGSDRGRQQPIKSTLRSWIDVARGAKADLPPWLTPWPYRFLIYNAYLGGVVWSSDGAPSPIPCRVCSRLYVSDKFSHFRQTPCRVCSSVLGVVSLINSQERRGETCG